MTPQNDAKLDGKFPQPSFKIANQLVVTNVPICYTFTILFATVVNITCASSIQLSSAQLNSMNLKYTRGVCYKTRIQIQRMQYNITRERE